MKSLVQSLTANTPFEGKLAYHQPLYKALGSGCKGLDTRFNLVSLLAEDQEVRDEFYGELSAFYGRGVDVEKALDAFLPEWVPQVSLWSDGYKETLELIRKGLKKHPNNIAYKEII